MGNEFSLLPLSQPWPFQNKLSWFHSVSYTHLDVYKRQMVDLSESRLEASKKFGATHTICSSDIDEIKAFINEVTDGRGVDISMECVGYPATFDVCQNIISVSYTHLKKLYLCV